MSLNMTGSTFSETEDDFSVCSFETSVRMVSFNKVPEVFTCDKNTNINGDTSALGDMCICQVDTNEEADYDVHLASTFKINNTEDTKNTADRRINKQMKYSNE